MAKGCKSGAENLWRRFVCYRQSWRGGTAGKMVCLLEGSAKWRWCAAQLTQGSGSHICAGGGVAVTSRWTLLYTELVEVVARSGLEVERRSLSVNPRTAPVAERSKLGGQSSTSHPLSPQQLIVHLFTLIIALVLLPEPPLSSFGPRRTR